MSETLRVYLTSNHLYREGNPRPPTALSLTIYYNLSPTDLSTIVVEKMEPEIAKRLNNPTLWEIETLLKDKSVTCLPDITRVLF